MENELKEKLEEMFDIDCATITKKQSCRVGRWAFTLPATVVACGLFALLVFFTMNFYGESIFWFLITVLTLVLAFALFRIWLGFAADLAGAKESEKCRYVRRDGERYYYGICNYAEKFEYSHARLEIFGKSYDKFDDESSYSRLGSRFSRAIARRSSMYTTMTADFWLEKIRDWDCEITGRGITASTKGESVKLECGEDGKITSIVYKGNAYALYDSCSPVRIFDCKLPGKYDIEYTFGQGAELPVTVNGKFFTAFTDFLLPIPDPECIVRGAGGEEEQL